MHALRANSFRNYTFLTVHSVICQVQQDSDVQLIGDSVAGSLMKKTVASRVNSAGAKTVLGSRCRRRFRVIWRASSTASAVPKLTDKNRYGDEPL